MVEGILGLLSYVQSELIIAITCGYLLFRQRPPWAGIIVFNAQVVSRNYGFNLPLVIKNDFLERFAERTNLNSYTFNKMERNEPLEGSLKLCWYIFWGTLLNEIINHNKKEKFLESHSVIGYLNPSMKLYQTYRNKKST